MAELAMKSKITLSDFNPKRIAAEPDTVKRLVLGVLIGRALDSVERQSPDKSQTFIGLRGDFEAYFAPYTSGDGKVIEPDPWKSGVLFMDDVFRDPILTLIADKVDDTGKVIQQGAEAVQFAFEISVQRAGNPQGYEWVVKPLNERPEAERQQDKLNNMRALLAKSSIPALAKAAPAPALADQSGGEQQNGKKPK